MPRRGSDALTEEIRSAVEQRTSTSELQAAVEAIALAEGLPKAHFYRRAVREFVERWQASLTPATPDPTPPTSQRTRGVFP